MVYPRKPEFHYPSIKVDSELFRQGLKGKHIHTEASAAAPISTCSTALSWTANVRLWSLTDDSCIAVRERRCFGYQLTVQ